MREPSDYRRPAVMSCACGAEWFSIYACHCAVEGCHHSFVSVESYEAHQPGGVCVAPADAGLAFDGRHWCLPHELPTLSGRGVGSGTQVSLFD